eukprot:jgi/Phyca11/14623/fgenesh1_pg.PHYCAscaffold_8_\
MNGTDTDHVSYDEPPLSGAGSFQLEFSYLAHDTKIESFMIEAKNVNKVLMNIVRMHYPNGLIPVKMDWRGLMAMPGSEISLGTLGDSHYEYLLKQWLLTGKQDNQLRDIYFHGMPTSHLELAKELTETCVQVDEQATQ